MSSIFEVFINLFFSIWENIENFLGPIISLIGKYTPKIIGFVSDLLSFLIDGLFSLIDGVKKFLTLDWLKFWR